MWGEGGEEEGESGRTFCQNRKITVRLFTSKKVFLYISSFYHFVKVERPLNPSELFAYSIIKCIMRLASQSELT